MLLKLLTGLSGSQFCLSPGDEHDFDDEAEAVRLVRAGIARPVDAKAFAAAAEAFDAASPAPVAKPATRARAKR